MADDVRVLIPRVRRAIDGPAALADGAGSTLTDSQVAALIADAIAGVIFYTGGVFGHELVVTDRDDSYGAPSAWAIEPGLSEAESTVIAAQAALEHFFHLVTELRVQETIRDEGQEWSYQLSAQALVERMRELQAARDRALEQVKQASPVPTAFVSFLHERDGRIAALVEPYARGVLGGGQERW